VHWSAGVLCLLLD